MIQDIAPRTYDNQFGSRRAPKASDLLLIHRKNQVLVKAAAAAENQLVYPTVGELAGGAAVEAMETVPGIYEAAGQKLIYLFAIDDEAFYAIDQFALPEKTESRFTWAEYQEAEAKYMQEILPGYELQPLTIFRQAKPGYLAFAGITGGQLARWRGDHKFCGRCGSKMQTSEKERAFVCPKCKATVYPKICPAVIVAIINDGKILVSRYAGRGNTPNYALLAGFAEVGETIEETVHREVLEEVGVKVKNLRFYKSQPWSFSDTLLMGFYCELDGDETISLDREELAMAAWLTPEELPERSSEISLTAEMMENFRIGKVR